MFSKNTLIIDMTFCSATVDLIADCTIYCNTNSIYYTVKNDNIVYFEVVKTY